MNFLYIFLGSSRSLGQPFVLICLLESLDPLEAHPPCKRASGVNVGFHQPKPLDTVFILEIRNRCL